MQPKIAKGMCVGRAVGDRLVVGGRSIGVGSPQAEHSFRILIDHVADRHSRCHLEKVRRKSFVETTGALSLKGPASNIANAIVGGRVQDRALGLQPGPKNIERVDDRGTKASAESTDGSRGDVVERHVVLVALILACSPSEKGAFQVFECRQVDRGVGEHSHQSKGETTEEAK